MINGQKILPGLYDKQQGHCLYCGVKTWLRQNYPDLPTAVQDNKRTRREQPRRVRYRQASIEHLKPLSEGGRDNIENLAMACTWCNNNRIHRSPVEHLRYVERRIARNSHPCWVNVTPMALDTKMRGFGLVWGIEHEEGTKTILRTAAEKLCCALGCEKPDDCDAGGFEQDVRLIIEAIREPRKALAKVAWSDDPNEMWRNINDAILREGMDYEKH